MNRFTFGLGYNEYNIDIENYKFLIGNNSSFKYSIYSIIKATFNKIKNSESAIEENNKHVMKFNEKVLDNREWKFFEVTPFFDLETDIKMGTKSLLSKYLDCFGDFLEQNEVYNTISILINSLNEDFFDEQTSISFGDKTIKLQMGEINRNILSKEVYPIIASNNYECNFADLNYEDIILIQLSIIEKILSKGMNYNAFVYCYIPHLTKKIEMAIYGMTYKNAYIVIDTNSIPNVNTENIYISGNHLMDLANDEEILDKIMDFPFHIEKEELINRVNKCLNEKKIDYSDSLMVELFS